MQFEITLEGDPVPKARPRMTRTGHVYTTKKTEDFERLVNAQCRSCMEAKGIGLLDEPVKVSAVFVMPVPKSYSNSKRQALMGRPHTHRPDVDNLLKAILDGMNGIVFRDDALVCSLEAVKVYGATPKAVVTVETFSK